jgi:hypothetical protein
MNMIALLLALSAQDAAYRQLLERTNAAAPAPALAAIQPEALAVLQGNAREERRCVPTSVALERLQSATAARAITEAVLSGEAKNGWTVYGRAGGCPTPFLARFMVVRMADDSLRVFLVNEGETLANPSLMRDTGHLAAAAGTAAVRIRYPGCDDSDLSMGPTRIADRSRLGTYSHGAYFSGAWSEVWTFRVCGHRVEVPVSFTADAQGGADYDIDGSRARILD